MMLKTIIYLNLLYKCLSNVSKGKTYKSNLSGNAILGNAKFEITY